MDLISGLQCSDLIRKHNKMRTNKCRTSNRIEPLSDDPFSGLHCTYIESYGEHEEEVCDDDEVVWPSDPRKLGGGRIFGHFRSSPLPLRKKRESGGAEWDEVGRPL